jgi:uncharacterized membrane protein
MTMHYGSFPFDGWIALALVIAVIAVIAVVVVIVVAAMQRRGGQPLDEADAILRARLARGEISVEDYDKTRQALGLK